MNFNKSGIFSRGAGETSRREEEKTGGVLAVWGSPGSGKTVTAVKLAKALADDGRNVTLLLCDMTAPMLPLISPGLDSACRRSLGSVLAVPHVSDILVKNNCITFKRLPNLALLGMLRGENEFTYPPYSAEQAKELISALRELTPYVVVDCGSYIANDILSAVALMEADSVLSLGGCDLKTVSYFASQIPVLEGAKMDMEKQYRVSSNVKPRQAESRAGAFKLPYSPEIEEQYLSGKLLDDLAMKDSREYRSELKRMIKEVF